MTVPETNYVHNPFGGFRIEWLNKYINEYLSCPLGDSKRLIRTISWVELKNYDPQNVNILYNKTTNDITKYQIARLRHQNSKGLKNLFME